MIFGLLFPLFMFLSFYLGRKVDLYFFFPGLLAMSLFFTASSVGPLITPWEKQAGTYERLLSFPVSINTIILGDILAGMIFGIIVNIIVLVIGLLFFNYSINILFLFFGILLASFCFSSLGVLLASPSASSPSHIMMFSSLIRFPLIFISGIFIPLGNLQGIARGLSYLSPITYLVDIFNFGFKGESDISLIVDFIALFMFSVIFIFLSNWFHKRNLMKGL
ncbi:MAG: ABC transporter permease [Planctomycetes bacterium]|nr:ABC transporter permease [Planctomycetota bacterium]MBL7144008.1 ABC transporter permease [Phycisphaerae bacterium]